MNKQLAPLESAGTNFLQADMNMNSTFYSSLSSRHTTTGNDKQAAAPQNL